MIKTAIVISVTEEQQEEWLEFTTEKEIPFLPVKGMNFDFWHFYCEVNHVTYSFSTNMAICEIEFSLAEYREIFCDTLNDRGAIIKDLIHRLIYEGFDLTNWTEDSQEDLAKDLKRLKEKGKLKKATS